MIVRCTLADGSIVSVRAIVLDEVSVGGADVENVDALVFEDVAYDAGEGLLGMSFLGNFRFEIDSDSDKLILRSKK